MQDFADFLASIPESAMPWVGVAGMLCVFFGTKIQSGFLRMIVIGIGVFLFVFTFIWMLQWLNVYENVGGALLS